MKLELSFQIGHKNLREWEAIAIPSLLIILIIILIAIIRLAVTQI